MMTDLTPYHRRPLREIAREQECMRRIFREAPEVSTVWEAFGGVGMTAQVLRERFPAAEITACDLDAECVRAYNARGFGLCYQRDAALGLENAPGGAWGASLDFNKFTLLDARGRPVGRWKMKLINAVIVRRPRWIQITDSAVKYLHIGYKAYGLEDKRLATYVAALAAELGLELIAWANHSAAAYLLFRS